MENQYPLFAGGRILKKEALWDLRDYVYGSMQLYYMDYTDGIVRGCDIHVEGGHLVIGKGILKYGDFLYLVQEEVRIPFEAENRLVALKAAFSVKRDHPDYLSYQVAFLLDQDIERQENQIELCRFHLREGSVLRDTYRDFTDLNTKYDTINLLYATVAGRSKERLHPKVLLKYAQELQINNAKAIEDIAFCYHIFQNKGEVERNVVEAYLQDKWGDEIAKAEEILENGMCFERLEALLKERVDNRDRGQRQRVIFVE
ncbi:MAG: hypothetical protein NC123_15025 [Butyrivibrio sp.]|nr:hypothetical protein [Butyrivibrio sp.]